MKNLRLFLFLSVFAFGVLSQANAQVGLGLKAGVNLANLDPDLGGLENDLSMIPAVHFGFIVDIDFSENLGLGTGLLYHGKGAKDADNDDIRTTLSYIQLPLQLQYSNSGLFVGVGPYVAMALSGNYKEGTQDDPLSIGNRVEDDFGPLDYGVGIEAGYEFGALRATASYNLGLANILPKDLTDEIDFSVKHAVIGVSLAYLFGQE